MYRVLDCLTTEHDWRLVLLAVAVCFLASGAAISLFHRAQVAQGRARLIWLGLDAAAAGFGIGLRTSSPFSRSIRVWAPAMTPC
jgi:NO-binding membrane sensor protein with MHYT domain